MNAAASTWRPTPALVRAVVVALGAMGAGSLLLRPDLVLLAVPFLGAATIGILRRPTAGGTRSSFTVDSRRLFEGQATTARVTVDAPLDAGAVVVTTRLHLPPWISAAPRVGARSVVVALSPGHAATGAVELDLPMRAIRWGRHEVGVDHVVCTSELGAFRTDRLVAPPVRVEVLPLADRFESIDTAPRPAGLVGLHRSRQQGSGTELAEVRPFVAGDRLRRINWRVTSRTGQLHVNATWTDRDSEVVLVLDTEHDVGPSTGLDGTASSLDTTVRAAAALAEHYLRAGDRVRLVDLGRHAGDMRSGSGRGQLRRILDVLVAVHSGSSGGTDPRRLGQIRPGALVIALTPLLGHTGVQMVAGLVQAGHQVIVVDTLPDDPFQADTPWRAVAVRLRLLDRRVEIDRLADLGVPTVVWRGPGTLDEVLRDVTRLGSAPRVRAGVR